MPKKSIEKKSLLFTPELEPTIALDKKNDIVYKNDNGELYWGDCIDYMSTIKNGSVDLIFADPPYNIKKDKWDCWDNMEEYLSWSRKWIAEASRVLKLDGTLYVCGFSEIIALIQASVMEYFFSCKWTIWNYKNKASLSNDWGRSHEAILCFRKGRKFTFNVDDVRIPYNAHTMKYPMREQGESSQYGANKKNSVIWSPNPLGAKPKDVIELPTTCNGMLEKTPHKTQKPEALVRKYILASSNPGDTILDPFCGSGTTPVCCEQLGRKWLACDLELDYLEWTVKRLKNVVHKDKQYWIDRDRDLLIRRENIRKLP